MVSTTSTIKGAGLRFDDKLATVLAQPRDDAAARAAAWRQIVDILAQAPPGASDPLSADAHALLRALRDEVPQPVRAEAVAALAGRRVHPAVVGLVAEERPAIAAVLIGQARLADGEWLFLLPRLSITARALLRHRRDLSPVVRTGLASFGASDFALPASAVGDVVEPSPPEPVATATVASMPDAPATIDAPLPEAVPAVAPIEPATSLPAEPVVPAAATVALDVPAASPPQTSRGAMPTNGVGDTPITDLLARIAAYRRDDAPAASAPPLVAFRFETGVDGAISWVGDAPRAALAGVTIARAAGSLAPGVDGQVAGAFRHRAPFRAARLLLGGGSALSGEWRIAGVPVFHEQDGRFAGYRGTARRPRLDEQTAPAPAGLYGTGLPADSLRQLVHELRTPINAIVGFGEMIERQVLGPAAVVYRMQAEAIVAQGRRLLGVVDDLDMAARAETAVPGGGADALLPDDLLRALWQDYRPIATARGVTLDLAIAPDAAAIEGDAAAVERMMARLLAATVGLAAAGETIACRLGGAGRAVTIELTRPAVLGDSGEAVLLDPGFSPEGDFPDAPLLGLGFALRLVRNLAMAAGGALEIEPKRFVLRLPAAGVRQADEASPG